MTLAFDNETFLIGQAQVAPPLVCVSFTDGEEVDVVHRRDPAAYRFARFALESEHELVGQNVPFDLAVWCNEWPDLLDLVFAAYDADRVVDTMVRQKLLDIAHGCYRGFRSGLTGVWIEHKYHLADLAKRHTYPVDLDKDTWRLRYNELVDLDVADWPEGAVDYSAHDALSTFHVWRAQEAERRLLDDQYRQCRAHWALHLMSAWGVRTDPAMVDRLEKLTRAMLADHEATLLEHKLIEPKKAGGFTKKVKRAQEFAKAAWERRGGEMVLTDGKQVSLSEDAAERLGDPVITAFQQFGSASTILARVEELRPGLLHTRFDELMQSGRTSSSKPNIQNRAVDIMVRPRCGHKVNKKKTSCPECKTPYEVAGDREAFVPREGCVLLMSDVPGLELRTIAQTCVKIVGYSRLGEILNAGRDPHIEVAATLRGISLEEAYRRKTDPNDTDIYLARQTGKVVNFGLNARLGWRGLIEQARTKYGVLLNEYESKQAIEAYYATLPEMREFHSWVDGECANGMGQAIHLFSGRVQGLLSPTMMSNTFSQGLGADATKAALYELARVCYVGRGQPLYGSRSVNYVHDDYHVETLEENLDAKSEQMADVICTEINKWLPDVPVPRDEMRPIAARRWSKKAKRELNPNGTLAVWEWQEWIRQQEER
jgi:hypothetical protein